MRTTNCHQKYFTVGILKMFKENKNNIIQNKDIQKQTGKNPTKKSRQETRMNQITLIY